MGITNPHRLLYLLGDNGQRATLVKLLTFRVMMPTGETRSPMLDTDADARSAATA
jgi:hypothetical protein